jgi:hypothetical protein
MVRNTGKHAAGIIITDKPLDEFVPLTLQEGDVTVQFDMNAVGKLGLLKMDFLGLKTLTVIADAVDNVRRTADPAFDIETIRSTTRRPTSCSTPARRSACSSSNPRHAERVQAGRRLEHRRHQRHLRALPPGPDGVHPRLRPRQEGPGHACSTRTRCSSSRCRRPTASSSTRSR